MLKQPDLRIGIDVGGTNTDAVVLDPDKKVLARHKAPTTKDLTSGIDRAIASVVGQLDVPIERVTHVMLGTTHATNAILERRDLLKTAIVRIGAPATLSIPPLLDWPADLREVVSVGEVIIPGGSEISGDPIVDLGEEELREFLESVRGTAEAIAITGVFSPVSQEHELRAEEIVREVLGPDIPVSLSHGIGSLGLLERENACALNASLVGVARKVVHGLNTAMERNNLNAVAYLTQNDGTLMGADYVLRYPVLTIGSGPANSMRGAGYLSDAENALVVDVGGTSTDVGVLVNGFPRESAAAVDIGGVLTNFRMPDLVSISVGGGTVCKASDDGIKVGPESVGYRISEEGLVFGGETVTLSDAAVYVGRASMGERSLVEDAPLDLKEVMAISDARVAAAIDQMKTMREDVLAIAVGGGSVILPEVIEGVSEVFRPADYDVANAIGAAIASVSGQIDKVYKLAGRDRTEIVDEAIAAARNEAISAGADPSALEIVELEEVPMAYLTDPVTRIRCKAAGPLGLV